MKQHQNTFTTQILNSCHTFYSRNSRHTLQSHNHNANHNLNGFYFTSPSGGVNGFTIIKQLTRKTQN